MAEIGLGLIDTARQVRRTSPRIASTDPRIAFLGLGEAQAIAADWAGLAARAADDNQFFHPDVVLAAAERIGHGVRLATVRNPNGHLIAAAPVTTTRLGRIAPATRIWSHDYGPLGVPLVDRGEIDVAAAAFIGGIAGPSGSLIVPDLPLDGRVAAALLHAAVREGRPVAMIDRRQRALLKRPDDLDIRKALPTRRRKEFARQFRRLADLGTLVTESISEPARVRARFEEFLILEAAGWKGRNRTALVSCEPTLGFARAMMHARAAAGTVRIDSIRLDRRPIAMLISFIGGATAWTWKIAYAEDFARFSPGAQLMLEAPRQLFADGTVISIDSLAAADHPMIDHLWPDRLSIGTLVIGPRPGNLAATLLHRLGLASARTEVRARAFAHRVRKRRTAPGTDKGVAA